MTETPAPPTPRGRRRPHHPTVGPRLSRWLAVVFATRAELLAEQAQTDAAREALEAARSLAPDADPEAQKALLRAQSALS